MIYRMFSQGAMAVALFGGLVLAPGFAQDRPTPAVKPRLQAAPSQPAPSQAAIPHCLESLTLSQTQQDQIAELQGKVQAQQETINSLKAQADRQASANADLQRQLARPPAVVQAAPPFYTYPPVGLGLSLNFGSPGIYGSPFYYPPLAFGPPFYGLRYRSYYGW